MAATSDERREVAARLRDYAKFRNFCPFESFFVRLNMILFGDNGWDRADGYVFEHLADLIDPTCRAVHQGTSMDDELVCSECGASLGVEVDGEQKFVSKFCPCCGARVVES